MARKSLLLLAAGMAFVVLGAAAWVYAGCGACGAGAAVEAKPTAEVQVTSTAPFKVLDVTGPAKGQELCYICRYGGRPSLVVFTRTTSGHFPAIAKAVDTFVAENRAQRAAGFIVLLGERNATNQAALAALAKEHGLALPLTIALDGPKGPASYKLEGHFDTVVLVTHKNKVHKAFALHCDAPACSSTKCAQTGDIQAAARKVLQES